MHVAELIKRGIQSVIDQYPQADIHGFGLKNGVRLHICGIDADKQEVKLGIGQPGMDVDGTDYFLISFDDLDHSAHITTQLQQQCGVAAFLRHCNP